ncbi:hypothetical protein [Burkholderia vietnamiensis]|uniref:hypothetical protein n=1 Tax=Burkholderia vietnamiensis TaxID=60552 RepID=UPI0012D8E5D5|nr:hypothetical protein [Burkholderia vietnamiensis]
MYSPSKMLARAFGNGWFKIIIILFSSLVLSGCALAYLGVYALSGRSGTGSTKTTTFFEPGIIYKIDENRAFVIVSSDDPYVTKTYLRGRICRGYVYYWTRGKRPVFLWSGQVENVSKAGLHISVDSDWGVTPDVWGGLKIVTADGVKKSIVPQREDGQIPTGIQRLFIDFVAIKGHDFVYAGSIEDGEYYSYSIKDGVWSFIRKDDIQKIKSPSGDIEPYCFPATPLAKPQEINYERPPEALFDSIKIGGSP